MLQQVTALPVDLFSFTLEEDVEALTVQTRRSYSEVDECDTRAEIWREQSILVTSQHEEGQLTIAGDFLVTNLHNEATADFLNLLVKDAVHDGIDLLNVLDQHRHAVLKTLRDTVEEVRIREACLLDLARAEMVHHVFESLI